MNSDEELQEKLEAARKAGFEEGRKWTHDQVTDSVKTAQYWMELNEIRTNAAYETCLKMVEEHCRASEHCDLAKRIRALIVPYK